MGEELAPEPAAGLTIGLTYNLKKGIHGKTEDHEAEYDSIETVHAIRNSLEKLGGNVVLLEADPFLAGKLSGQKIDIVFNIAEGIRGRGREAEVPALLNVFGIPFVGSDETTLCVALDKALAKRLLSTYGIPTPKFRLITEPLKENDDKFTFPAIVKPNAEGSSKGIPDACVTDNLSGLRKMLDRNFDLYGQDMLVEEFIPGREFTVGLLGNGKDLKVFTPMEIVYLKQDEKYKIYSYNVKKNYQKLIRYDCPPEIERKSIQKMIRLAKKIYNALSCKDFARIDFRLSEEGKVYFIEINPLPGLAPGYSDYPMLADFNGMKYDTLVQNILLSALKRHGISFNTKTEMSL